MAQEEGKYGHLLKDADIDRWLRNIKRGSPITAEVAHRRLGRTCELLSTTPQEMIKSATKNMKQFQDSLEDMVTDLETDGKAPSYILGLLKAVKSWLRYNNITLTRTIKVSHPTSTPTLVNEEIPSHEELAQILRTSPPRIRTAEALMAFADLRPESIGNHYGTDGLVIRDLPELKIENGQVKFEKIPTRVIVRDTISKTGHKYNTFLSQEGCGILKEYLEQRIRNGEKLAPDTPIFGHEKPRKTTKNFATTSKITHFIRKCMRSAGVYKRPYVLRAYAETQFTTAESDGKISHSYFQHMAGHAGDIESKYSTNKGRLPPTLIESMRSKYQACEPYLSTAPKIDQLDVVKQAKLELLQTFVKHFLGENVDIKLNKITGEELTTDEMIEIYEEKLSSYKDKQLVTAAQNARFGNKLIEENELETYLNEGWEMMQVVNSKILVRKRIDAPQPEIKQQAKESHLETKENVEVKHDEDLKRILGALSEFTRKPTKKDLLEK